MEIFVFQTSSDWEKANGAAVVIAESIDRAETLLQDYEMEADLRCYESDNEAREDVNGPFRHVWVLVESLKTEEKAERIVISSWDEAP